MREKSESVAALVEYTSVRAIEWRKAEGTDAPDSAKKSEHAKEIKSIECKRIKLLLTNFFPNTPNTSTQRQQFDRNCLRSMRVCVCVSMHSNTSLVFKCIEWCYNMECRDKINAIKANDEK